MTWHAERLGTHVLRHHELLCGEVRSYKGRWSSFAFIGDGQNLGTFDTISAAMNAVSHAVSMVTGWTWIPRDGKGRWMMRVSERELGELCGGARPQEMDYAEVIQALALDLRDARAEKADARRAALEKAIKLAEEFGEHCGEVVASEIRRTLLDDAGPKQAAPTCIQCKGTGQAPCGFHGAACKITVTCPVCR